MAFLPRTRLSFSGSDSVGETLVSCRARRLLLLSSNTAIPRDIKSEFYSSSGLVIVNDTVTKLPAGLHTATLLVFF